MIRRYNRGTVLLWLTVICGGLVFLLSLRQISSAGSSTNALLLCLATLIFSVIGSVSIPGVKINLTVSDGFILTAVIFFGIPTAVALSFADAFLSSLRITKSNTKRAFNAGAMAVSIFISARVVGWIDPAFFDLHSHRATLSEIAFPIALLGLLHYLINSSIVSTVVALRTGRPILKMWQDDLLWTSISYFMGASVAGFVYWLITMAGFNTFIIAVPILIITFLTYKTYMNKVETSRKQALSLEEVFAKVSKGKREWEVTFDTLSEAIYIFDENGKIIRLNKAGQQLEARLRGSVSLITEFPGMDALSLGLFEQPEAQQNFIRAQAGQDLSFELRLRDCSSGWMDLGVTATAIEFDVFEESVPLLVVARDITEQKRLRQQLLQAEKMSAVGELVSGVAHELNNPLTTVIGFSQLLRMSGRLDEDDEADLKLIISEAERAREIVANLLTFARQTHSEKEKVSVNEVVERVLALRAYNLRTGGIDVELDLDKSVPYAVGNFHQLQQVLLNVITNAEQAMIEANKGSVLSVETKTEGDYLTITVADNGPGISPENVSRIFDPFFTTKPQGKGTGLGLSISYGIIREHGGDISVSSVAEQGAKFVITLPAVNSTHESLSPAELPSSTEKSSLSILIVDDEPGILGFLEKALTQIGHSCSSVGNVDLALDLLSRQAFDVIVSDVRMPRKDGSVLYHEATTHNPQLVNRFIFMTGDAISDKTSAFLESVNATYISKPFKISDMVAMIERQALRSSVNSEPTTSTLLSTGS